jgi:hypothetical protein
MFYFPKPKLDKGLRDFASLSESLDGGHVTWRVT